MSTDEKKSGRKRMTEDEKEVEKSERQKYHDKISKRITNLIASRNVLQQDVADYLGMSKQAFSAYMRAKDHFFSIEMLHKIADYFHCDIDYLIRRQDAPNHDAADVCKYTGLSSETIEILHEGVETYPNGYRLFIDLFEYMLKQNKMSSYEYNNKPVFYHADTDTSYLMNNIVAALMAQRSTVVWNEKQAEIMARDGDVPEEVARQIASSVFDAEDFLLDCGRTSLPSKDAKQFYLRLCSEDFVKIVESFVDEKADKDPRYLLKAKNPLIYNKQMRDAVEGKKRSKKKQDQD